MIKRKLSLVLVLAMLLSLMIPTVAFGAVKDYSGHWAEKTIQAWFDKGMLKGYEDGSFRPNQQITRAEFMTVVNSAFEFTEKAEVDFNDVDSDDWYYEHVQVAVKAGYLIGYEDNTARPGQKITRQEAALIIARIKDLDNYAAGAAIFNDVAEIAKWAIGGVGAVADEGYMIGYEDVTFRPLKFISRAEAVVTIDRALDKVEEETPGTGGGGGGGGGGNGGSQVTTAAAIISNFTIADPTTQSAITLSEVTTDKAIFITTSSAITISAITTEPDGAKIEYSITLTSPTTSSAVTGTAINSDVINIELPEVGEYEVTLTVLGENKIVGRKKYTDDTTYVFIITRD